MKRIDVENAITKHIEKRPYRIIDTLSNSYTISSYEKYVECFDLIYNTYKDNIREFSEEGKKYKDNINLFIQKILEDKDEDSMEQYIEDNLDRELGFSSYDRSVNLISIYPESFLMQRECSQEAFINIYEELGYQALKDYIRLVQSPQQFSYYLSDDKKQIIAMKFLLYKTDHHSPTKLKRDLSAKTIFEMNSEHIQECMSEITKEKDDYINYMDEQKNNYNDWFSETENKLDEFVLDHSNKLSNIEETYEEKLKVEEPAKFMLEQSEKYRKSFTLWCVAIIVLTIILLILLAFIVSPQVSFGDKLITVNVLNSDMPIYSSVILLAMISLVVYVLRIFIKMAISSKHLMEEYKQKYSLTYFYLSLVNNGSIEEEKSRNIILTSLFTKADTGLIKNDNSNEIDKTILSLLTK